LILTTLTKKQNKGQIHDFYYKKHFCVKALQVKAVFRQHIFCGILVLHLFTFTFWWWPFCFQIFKRNCCPQHQSQLM